MKVHNAESPNLTDVPVGVQFSCFVSFPSEIFYNNKLSNSNIEAGQTALWLRKLLVLFQATQVWFQAPMLDRSWLPVTSTPRDPMLSSVRVGTCTCISRHRYTKRKTYTYPLDILINLYNKALIDYKQTIYSKTKLQLDSTGLSLLFHL